ncbi:MAG: aldehyde dehydrogenase family protein [Actinobacteria bacterium]|nr:aldehyde dehydrogenase family protein [Actinomycetota bacterium]
MASKSSTLGSADFDLHHPVPRHNQSRGINHLVEGEPDAALRDRRPVSRFDRAGRRGRRAGYLAAAPTALEARLEAIARDMMTEMGKPLRAARMETARAAQIHRFAAGEAYRAVGEISSRPRPKRRSRLSGGRSGLSARSRRGTSRSRSRPGSLRPR